MSGARPVVAVVLAGGIGSRLYPASRSYRPKQFLSLPVAGDADASLLEATVDRAAAVADETVVCTRAAFAPEARERAPDATVIVEPAGKDTGPALTYATHEARARFGECVVLALPSDHRVDGDFESTARRATDAAVETEGLVAVGAEPTRPDTGYGYVEPGADRGTYRELVAFHEKPDAGTAARYVEEGYLWNAGIFAWTPAAFFDAAAESPLTPLVAALAEGDAERGFEAVDPVSVDYAVMERAAGDGGRGTAVVPATFAWDDLGSWDALERVLEADADGNVTLGESLTVDATGNVVASDGKHVSLVGVSDLAVVAWDDRVLVVPTDDAQRVREAVAKLKERGRF